MGPDENAAGDPQTAGRRESPLMATLRTIETGPSLVFDALVGGAADAPLVLLLHGFSVQPKTQCAASVFMMK
jgi:hypothetical protein